MNSLQNKQSEVKKLERKCKLLTTALLLIVTICALTLLGLAYYTMDKPVIFNVEPKDTVIITNN